MISPCWSNTHQCPLWFLHAILTSSIVLLATAQYPASVRLTACHPSFLHVGPESSLASSSQEDLLNLLLVMTTAARQASLVALHHVLCRLKTKVFLMGVQCWANVCDVDCCWPSVYKPLGQRGQWQVVALLNLHPEDFITRDSSSAFSQPASQPSQDIYPMLFQCWASVEDGGPTLTQHWVNASCLLR